MSEPQPGLRPIIPQIPAQPGPSPLIPVIVLVIIVILRWFFQGGLGVWGAFGVLDVLDVLNWGVSFDSIQSQLTIAVFLIPLCLLLAIQAFGIPQVNPVRNAPPLSPFVTVITQNLGSSILLLFVIVALLLSIPSRQTMQEMRPSSVSAYATRGFQSGVCQELGILKRRCENWKGSSRDSVCRDLAALQRRCERGGF